MIHKTLQTQRGELNYWIQGQGNQTLMFTHGATMDHGLFQDQIDFFSKKYQIINWDVPLHGLSKPYDSFSLRNAAKDLISILDKEKVSNAHLVGQSMGGYISQIAAAEYPNRIKTLTAVDSSPIQLSYYSKLDRWLLLKISSILKLYPLNFLVKYMSNQICIKESARLYAFETLKKYSKQEIIEIMSKVYFGLLENDKSRLDCPILIVYGDKDKTGKVKAYCNRWAKNEGRELKIIPNAAHNANMDNPEIFNQYLEDFIQSNS